MKRIIQIIQISLFVFMTIFMSACNDTKTKNDKTITKEESNKTILDEYISNRISKAKESKIYKNLDLKPNEK